jgi:hypothetical protein
MHVFIAEPDFGWPETTLPDLRCLAADLPFEAAMLQLALLNFRVESVLTDAAGHWQLAQGFYEGDEELLQAYLSVPENRHVAPGYPVGNGGCRTLLSAAGICAARFRACAGHFGFLRGTPRPVRLPW